MKTIKLRAWHNNTMYKVDTLGLRDKGIDSGMCFAHKRRNPHITENCIRFDTETIFEQFTGLKDKNGVEIYEGDKVKMRIFVNDYDTEFFIDGYYIGIVRVIPSMGVCLYKPKFENNDGNDYIYTGYKTISSYRSEVIGNIHKNPELLK